MIRSPLGDSKVTSLRTAVTFRPPVCPGTLGCRAASDESQIVFVAGRCFFGTIIGLWYHSSRLVPSITLTVIVTLVSSCLSSSQQERTAYVENR